MQMTLLCHGPLESLPPLMNVSYALLKAGIKLRVAASTIEGRTQEALAAAGAEPVALCPSERVTQQPWNRVGRHVGLYFAARKLLQRLPAGEVLWVGSATTAVALRGMVHRFRYVLQLHELYDNRRFFRRLLRPAVADAAAIVVPEQTRADIVSVWYGLDQRPIVLPNKPLSGNYSREMRIVDPAVQRILDPLSDANIVLYQGMIHPDRDLRPLAHAIHLMGSGWRLLVMGKDWGALDSVREVCPSLVHLPYILPPEHLAVTSRARVGVITYTPTSLNHLFCAPNKLWEFAAFGIPVMCDDLPALRTAVHTYGSGVVTRFRETGAVQSALREISANYDRYSTQARRMFAAVDEVQIVQRVVEQLEYA